MIAPALVLVRIHSMRNFVESLESRQMLATFTVTALADAGAGSLRQALLDANALPGADIIDFNFAHSGTINLASVLSITDDVSINGPGASILSLNGADATGIFAIFFGDVSLSGLTIANGNVADEGGGIRVDALASLALSNATLTGNHATGSGGAIANFGVLTLVNTTIFSNTTGTHGGAIFNTGTVTITNSDIGANTADLGGGAIRNEDGALTITGTTIDDNTATGDGGGISTVSGTLSISNSIIQRNDAGLEGGGIFSDGTATTITNTAFSANTTLFRGGGLHVDGGTATVANSTFSGNSASVEGGGIFNNDTLSLASSTISGNDSDVTGGGIYNVGTLAIDNSTIANNTALTDGGGIFHAGGTLTIRSSIVADNTGGDIEGVVAAGSINNLIGDASTAGGLFNGAGCNIVGFDPLLAPLADNGGLTQTHALLPGSPALGMGINPLALTIDQRGQARLEGSRVDIGAFEATVPPTPGGTSEADDTHHVVWVDEDGNILVYEQGWTYVILQEKTTAPAAIDDAVIWVDPKDGLTYVAAPTDDGLLLFSRSETGVWSFRNLTTETAATSTPTRHLTRFISIREKIVVVAGLTADGRVVAFQQTLEDASGGGPAFEFVDISDDLESQGFATPDLTGLTSYVPKWDTWHLAGVDTEGRIQSIWINTNNAAFTKWRANDLSAITGAPAIAGQLAVTLTSWGGINLTGLDIAGNLLTTWWVPRFEGQWAISNLTDRFDGPPLVGGNITAYTTSWGGINYVGVDSTGTTRVYWWVPSFEGEWAVSRLLPPATPPELVPTGALSSSSSEDGTLNVYGLNTDGHVLRMWWEPSATAWTIEDLTDVAVKV